MSLSYVSLSYVSLAECRYAECHNAECHSAECRGAIRLTLELAPPTLIRNRATKQRRRKGVFFNFFPAKDHSFKTFVFDQSKL